MVWLSPLLSDNIGNAQSGFCSRFHSKFRGGFCCWMLTCLLSDNIRCGRGGSGIARLGRRGGLGISRQSGAGRRGGLRSGELPCLLSDSRFHCGALSYILSDNCGYARSRFRRVELSYLLSDNTCLSFRPDFGLCGVCCGVLSYLLSDNSRNSRSGPGRWNGLGTSR